MIHNLSALLPKAVTWATQQSSQILQTGVPLTSIEAALAVRMGVTRVQDIRIQMVSEFPRPEDPELFAFAKDAGFFAPTMHGLTLGHGIIIRHVYRANRLVSHECRHVFQYEQHGSIDAFLQIYLAQIGQLGYWNAPLERDAYAHQTDA